MGGQYTTTLRTRMGMWREKTWKGIPLHSMAMAWRNWPICWRKRQGWRMLLCVLATHWMDSSFLFGFSSLQTMPLCTLLWSHHPPQVRDAHRLVYFCSILTIFIQLELHMAFDFSAGKLNGSERWALELTETDTELSWWRWYIISFQSLVECQKKLFEFLGMKGAVKLEEELS